MGSFAKDVLSGIILATWVLPVVFVALSLIAARLAALVHFFMGLRGKRLPVRQVRGRAPAELSATPAVRRYPVKTVGMSAPLTSFSRPRVAARWKSSQRLSMKKLAA